MPSFADAMLMPCVARIAIKSKLHLLSLAPMSSNDVMLLLILHSQL